jgi:hypothetical protein
LAVTQFVTQFTHVSQHPQAYNRKLKFYFMDNSFQKLLSDMWPIFHKTTLFLSEKKNRWKKIAKLIFFYLKVSKIFGGV